MAESVRANTIAKQTVEELSTRFSEPAWLVESRLSAWEAYYKLPMPTDKDEGWRRTDIDALDLSTLKAAAFPAARELDSAGKHADWLSSALSHFGELSGLLYQSAGEEGFCTLNAELKARGVLFCDMSTAVVKHADKIRPYFSAAANADEEGKFSLLCKALFNCGFFLYVPRGVEIEAPFFYALNINCGEREAVLPRLLVLAEDNSRLTLAVAACGQSKEMSGSGGLSLLSQYAQIQVQPGAKLSFLEVQQPSSETFLVNCSNCFVERDGRYESLTLALGGYQTKSDIATVLNAPGASSELLGVVLGQNQEKFSFNTIQEHAAPDTKSDINFRVALKDKSASIYQGIVRVAKEAQRTEAYQSNKNLLLEGSASADSIPKLEILADDVKCSHGATVGPVDREQIFYLMSRGVSRPVAEQLIVLGFFRQTLEKFPLKRGLDWIIEAVSKKIHQNDHHSSLEDFFAR